MCVCVCGVCMCVGVCERLRCGGCECIGVWMFECVGLWGYMCVHVCIFECFRMCYFNRLTAVYPEPGELLLMLHFAESMQFSIFGQSCPPIKGTGHAFSQFTPHLVHTKP